MSAISLEYDWEGAKNIFFVTAVMILLLFEKDIALHF